MYVFTRLPCLTSSLIYYNLLYFSDADNGYDDEYKVFQIYAH